MASTYSPNLRIELIGTGDQSGTWGTTTNVNLGTLIEQAIAGYSTVSITDADYTLTTNNGAVDQARSMALNITSSVTLSATRNVICPLVSKLYVVRNATTGGQSIVLKTSTGTGVTIASGLTAVVLCNGTDVIDAVSGKQTALGYTPVNKAGDTMTGLLTLSGPPTVALHAATKAYVDSQTNLGYTPVNKAGDTMTGLLILSGNPAVNLGAATKQYVDSAVAGGGLGYTPVNKAGDTMTGLLVLSADPSAALGAATKQYVDTGLGTKQASLGFTPVNKAGDTMTGLLTLSGPPTVALHAATKAYVDAQSGLGYTPVNKAGDTMTGLLTLSADPSTNLQAATKQYVDNGLSAKQNSLGFTPVNKAGDTMTGSLVLNADPSVTLGAATKGYVDTGLSGKQNSLGFTPVNKAGDTMTGALTLPGDPSTNLQAATKQYVDNGLSAKQNSLGFTPVNKAGDTMTGLLTLSGPPTVALHAATKAYVDSQSGLGYTPVNKAGDTMTGALILSADPAVNLGAATKQYVDSGLSGKQNSLGFTPVNKAGDTMTGSLVLNADPAAALGAATKQYVDTGLSAKQNSLGYTPVNKSGDTMLGALVLNADPSASLGAATKQYVDSGLSSKQAALGYTPVNKAGDTMSGGLGFTGSATRIQGDFSNATLVNRTAFQDKTTNNVTAVYVLPNGTATSSGWVAFNNSDPTNAGYIGIDSNSTVSRIVSANTGSGTAVPLTFSVGAGGPEVARFDTSGRFCLGVTSGSTIAGAVNALGYASRSGSSGSFSGNVYNLYWNGTGLEAWVDTGSLGVINTTSDYRIKQNVVTQTANAVDRVNALRPVTYQIKDAGIFKADGVTREGFIAHELAEIIPSAVNGVKDALTEDGNIQPQSLRLDPIIAVLTKAIQELSARVAALEAN